MNTIRKELSHISFYLSRTDKLFWVLLVIFITIPVLYFSYVPIWDGWEFSKCYLNAAVEGSLWCHDHSAFLHTFLFGLTQKVDPGNFKLIYTLNILIGILGLVCMRSLLEYLFGDRLSRSNLTLITFCFGLNPVFLVHIIQPSLDFTLPILLVILLLCMFKRQFYYAACAGFFMVFTKESGFMLYGVSAFLFIPLLLVNERSLLRDKRKLAGRVGVLATPLLIFIIYMLLVPNTQAGKSWVDAIQKMFRFYIWTKLMMAQLISVFVLNFNWIITAFVAVNAFVLAPKLYRTLKNKETMERGFGSICEQLYFYILIAAVVYFLTRVPFVNNPRYMLPVLPLLIILFAGSLVNVLGKQSLITAVLSVILILLSLSSFRTIDFVSRLSMGTFKFGSHDILNMARFDWPLFKFGYGRDQLVYNFEFTKFHYLTEKMINSIGSDKVFVIPPGTTWIPNFNIVDANSGRRAMYGDDLKRVSFIFSSFIKERYMAPEEFYYISYPHKDKDEENSEERKKLSRLYDLEGVVTIEDDGYAIDVYHYIKKNG